MRRVTLRQAIEEVKSRFDILDIVQRHLVLKRSGSNYLAVCPFHADKSPSLSISPGKGFYKCFACGAGGDMLKFLMEFKKMPFVDVVRELAAECGLEIVSGNSLQEDELAQRIFGLNELACKFYESNLSAGVGRVVFNYLSQLRQLSGDSIERFRLGYAPYGSRTLFDYVKRVDPDAAADFELMRCCGLFASSEDTTEPLYDRFRSRIMIPIFDVKGRVIAFGGRSIGNEDGAKYINSPETPIYRKGENLFGLFQAKDACRQNGRIILLEGYFDVIQAHQHGINDCVAGLGTALTPRQVLLLYRSNSAHKIVLAYDSDEAGRRALRAAVRTAYEMDLSPPPDLCSLVLNNYKDVDECICAGELNVLKEMLASAPLAYLQIITELCATLTNEGDPMARRRLLEDAVTIFGTVRDQVLRELIAEALSAGLGFGKHTVLSSLQQVKGSSVANVAGLAGRTGKPRNSKIRRVSSGLTSKPEKILIALLYLSDDPELNAVLQSVEFVDEAMDAMRRDLINAPMQAREKIHIDEDIIRITQELAEAEDLMSICKDCLAMLESKSSYSSLRAQLMSKKLI